MSLGMSKKFSSKGQKVIHLASLALKIQSQSIVLRKNKWFQSYGQNEKTQVFSKGQRTVHQTDKIKHNHSKSLPNSHVTDCSRAENGPEDPFHFWNNENLALVKHMVECGMAFKRPDGTGMIIDLTCDSGVGPLQPSTAATTEVD